MQCAHSALCMPDVMFWLSYPRFKALTCSTSLQQKYLLCGIQVEGSPLSKSTHQMSQMDYLEGGRKHLSAVVLMGS